MQLQPPHSMMYKPSSQSFEGISKHTLNALQTCQARTSFTSWRQLLCLVAFAAARVHAQWCTCLCQAKFSPLLRPCTAPAPSCSLMRSDLSQGRGDLSRGDLICALTTLILQRRSDDSSPQPPQGPLERPVHHRQAGRLQQLLPGLQGQQARQWHLRQTERQRWRGAGGARQHREGTCDGGMP
jgi:hypothetical protein